LCYDEADSVDRVACIDAWDVVRIYTVWNIVFDQLVSLSRQDRRSALILFAFGFGNAGAYVIARTVADSLFLSRVGPEELPKIYLAAAGIVAISSAFYGRIVRNISVRLTVLLTLVALAASSAAMPQLTKMLPTSYAALVVVYLLAQVRGSLGTIQYTMLLNEQFANRQPERIVGVVGLGATLAGFSFGLSLGYLTTVHDLSTLMYLVAVVDVVTLVPVWLMPRGKTYPPRESIYKEYFRVDKSGSEPDLDVDIADSRKSNYIVSIAVMVAIGVVAATIVEFQWKVTAAIAFGRNETELARYFGYFHGCVYLITGGIQLFATGRLLERRGLLAGLLLFPSALLVACLAAFFSSIDRLVLWSVTFAKGCDTLKRGMNDPAIQILYGPLSGGRRHEAVTLVAGITKPLAEAATALGLLAITPFVPARYLSLFVIVLVILWLRLDVRVWRAYRLLDGVSNTDSQSTDDAPMPP